MPPLFYDAFNYLAPMSDFLNITDFLTPVNLFELTHDEIYKDGQIGKVVNMYDEDFPDISDADFVIIGCGEQRGSGFHKGYSSAPDIIRKQFYALYNWHFDIKIADIGNIKHGSSLADSYAGLRTVINELINANKTVIILGGSHDLALAQYYAHGDNKKAIEATTIDAMIDLNIDSVYRNDNFLMEMLTGEPNFIRHYNHIAFQSFYVHPRMLETMDKLHFDCFRVGTVKENIDEMEPVIRNSHMLTLDISAIANAYAPANIVTPNGLNGEDACMLFRYAGMSSNIKTIGIYNYHPELDKEELTAKQISQMLWYMLDGRSRGRKEASIDEKESFNEYYLAFAEVETMFIQSKKTGRWWMQLPDKRFIACSYKDYLLASSNEIPERWMRAQERD